jgi:hypothetical protein
MRLRRIGDWIQYSYESGETFYYNEATGEFQWVQQSQDSQAAAIAGQDWKPFRDPVSGMVFWHNSITGESQWDCPVTLAPHEEEDGVIEVTNESQLGL